MDEYLNYLDIGRFLNERGYNFEFDENGLWIEDHCTDHKWKDIFNLMIEWRNLCEEKPDYADDYID